MTAQEFAAWVAPLAARDGESRAEAVRLARSLADADLAKPTGDTGWCVRDELAHMASADPDFLRVLGAVLRGEKADTSVFADIDGKNVRGLAEREGRSMEQIAGELEESGKAMAALLARLNDADQGRQPEGVPFPLGGLVAGYSQHGAYHIAQIQAALGLASTETVGR
jgi:uncharacterized damage-inducible protein DinB